MVLGCVSCYILSYRNYGDDRDYWLIEALNWPIMSKEENDVIRNYVSL